MSRDVLRDVRILLEGESQPLSLAQLTERLAGEHDEVTIEQMLEHFQLEGTAVRGSDGSWGWRGAR